MICYTAKNKKQQKNEKEKKKNKKNPYLVKWMKIKHKTRGIYASPTLREEFARMTMADKLKEKITINTNDREETRRSGTKNSNPSRIGLFRN